MAKIICSPIKSILRSSLANRSSLSMSHPVERSQRQVARQPVPARCSGQFLHHDPVALDFVQAKKVRPRASMCFRSTPKPRPTMAARGRNDLQSFFQTELRRLCASVYRHAARLDRPGPFVDLGGDKFGKVFRASALRRCNILTNRFEAFTDERQIEGGA